VVVARDQRAGEASAEENSFYMKTIVAKGGEQVWGEEGRTGKWKGIDAEEVPGRITI